MYYVPDGTKICGYFECKNCKERFLSLTTAPSMVCPGCGEEPDWEIGPDEDMPVVEENAVLLQLIEGEEEVEKMDRLLSLAITGGDYEWI
ncbi:MAG: hypothetical protein IJ409_01690 [Lachnospiraceae bacterium]|nr:hypothetical protein [Lachnospiraceae bacterium]